MINILKFCCIIVFLNGLIQPIDNILAALKIKSKKTKFNIKLIYKIICLIALIVTIFEN